MPFAAADVIRGLLTNPGALWEGEILNAGSFCPKDGLVYYMTPAPFGRLTDIVYRNDLLCCVKSSWLRVLLHRQM
jgi:hypothetical protein